MKILLGFFIGTTVALLLVLTMYHNGPSVSADDSAATVTVDNPASALPDGTDVNGLMPDVKKIYNNALGGPYRQWNRKSPTPILPGIFAHTWMLPAWIKLDWKNNRLPDLGERIKK